MSTHNICFRREIRKILCGYPLLSVAIVLPLFVPHLSFFGCLGKAVLRDYGISLVSS